MSDLIERPIDAADPTYPDALRCAQTLEACEDDLLTEAQFVRWQGQEIERLTAERDDLRRQFAEAEQDARRYQWLRENLGKWRIETYQTPEQSMVELHVIGDSCFYSGESFDRIIDGLTRPAEE